MVSCFIELSCKPVISLHKCMGGIGFSYMRSRKFPKHNAYARVGLHMLFI